VEEKGPDPGGKRKIRAVDTIFTQEAMGTWRKRRRLHTAAGERRAIFLTKIVNQRRDFQKQRILWSRDEMIG